MRGRRCRTLLCLGMRLHGCSCFVSLFAVCVGCSAVSGPGAPPVANTQERPAPDAAVLLDGASGDADSEVADAADGASEAREDSDAALALHVLFIGNSYTSVNDLPGLLRRIAETSGQPPTIVTDSVTAGGATLQDHWQAGAARSAIDKGGWTHVVLQGQSVEPLGDALSTFHRYALLLAAEAKDAGASPALFETWARAPGDAVYQEAWSGGTPDAMQDKLLSAYAQAATDSGSMLVKVGEAWRSVPFELHQTDLSHPNPKGSWLAACVFYVMLTGRPVPIASEVPSGVSSSDAEVLRNAAVAAAN
jgi:hypothetical protein